MARPKKSAAQEDRPEQSADVGHNSGELTPAEGRALMFHHFRLIEAQKVVVKAAQDDLKKLRKTAKADGLVMADLDFMARCADLEDPTIAPAELKRRAEIASWFALPVNFQPDMFTDRMPLDDRAYEEGIAAGLQGKDPVAPYDQASGTGQRWLQGWHEGQRQMRDELVTAMTKKNSANAAKDELIHGADHDGDPFEEAAE